MTLEDLLSEFKSLIHFIRYVRDKHPDVYDEAIDFSRPSKIEDPVLE